MAIRAPDEAKNGLILPTGQWYAPSAVNYSAPCCTMLHDLALSCTILHYISVVKGLLKKNVQIIALKHCFVQNDDSLANYCTEALLGGKEGEHSITLRV